MARLVIQANPHNLNKPEQLEIICKKRCGRQADRIAKKFALARAADTVTAVAAAALSRLPQEPERQ